MFTRKFTRNKKLHLVVLSAHPFVASAISLAVGADPFISTLLFLGVPSAYMTYIFPSFALKSGIFSVILAIPFVFIVDYMGHFNGQWYIAMTDFPFRILNLVPFEDLIWAFLLSYFMLTFYEYFFDTHRDHALWPDHLKYLILLLFGAALIVLSLSVFKPSLLLIPYFYLCVGTVGILLPIIIEFARKPHLMQRAFMVGAYFFVFALVYELTALKIGWLVFPGKDFIGWVSLSSLSFPFEEFFFWILLTAMAAVTYYEYFDDDER